VSVAERTAGGSDAGSGPGLWLVAQWSGIVLTVALLASLVRWPAASLDLLWYAVIPLLPASFLMTPQLWRNVCPLATLNTLTGDRIGTRQLQATWVGPAGGIGILLLFLMVPARRFLFNVDGPSLAITVACVGLLALVGGMWFEKKGGFCNSVCPVLPVERLYGQRPLLNLSNPRCLPCTTCTRMACLDLMPEKSAHRVLGPGHVSRDWMGSVYGAFALAFPGFVVGYYLTADGPLSAALDVYATVLMWSAGSWLLLAALSAIVKLTSAHSLLMGATLAISAYYWFAPPGIATAYGLPNSFVWGMRLAMGALISVWLVRGWSVSGPRRDPLPPAA